MEDWGLGIFNEFWDGNPNHLPFLDLLNPQNSLSILDNILSQNSQEDIIKGISLLLEDENWRMHLVALLAILKSEEHIKSNFTSKLWERLELGSWVSPQISVVLSLIDTDFKVKAKDLLVKSDSNNRKVSMKTIASMEYLLESKIVEYPYLDRKITPKEEYLQKINELEKRDRGGIIAKKWKEKLLKLKETKVL